MELERFSPAEMGLATLQRLDRTWTPAIVANRRVPYGVYVPCNFTDDGEPEWQEVIDLIKKYVIAQVKEQVETRKDDSP